MTTLIEQIEAMRIRMNELSTEEHGLVRTLGEGLANADQRLMEDVRSISAAHEARRGAILSELQMLAARMFAMPAPRAPFAALQEVTQEQQAPETGAVSHRGDWRRAAANVQEEIVFHLKKRAG